MFCVRILEINPITDMWHTIFYWSLLSFGVLHFCSGCVALANLRASLSLQYTWMLPFIFTMLGGLIPCTAGVITGLVASQVIE